MKRMISDKQLRTENGDVIINDGMSVSDAGDVVVGRDLTVDGTIVLGDTVLTEEDLIALLALLS